MVMNLVASISAWLFLVRAQVRLRLLLIPLLLLIAVGPHLGILGLAAGLIFLALPIGKRPGAVFVQEIAAAGVAVLAGFRIEFVTDPSGGFIYLTYLAIPLTILWIVLVLRLREGIRRALPRPAVQLAIDLIIVSDACLLSLAAPGADGIARLLPVILLGVVLTSFMSARGKGIGLLHRGIAFSIALYGIGGVMKGAMSLALLFPLALMAFPMMISSRAFFAPPQGEASSNLPSWRRISADGLVLSSLLIISALSLAAVLAVHRSVNLALLSLLVLPLMVALWKIGHLKKHIIIGRMVRSEGARISLFGIPLSKLSLKEAVVAAEGMLQAGGSHFVVTPNTVSLMQAQRDRALLAAYGQADLTVPDGVGLVWATRLLGVPLPERVPGINLAEELLRTGGYRVFLLGGKAGVAVRAKEHLLQRFPGLDIVGAQHGYFSDEEEIIDVIRKAQPDILLVGMGVPRQELFMLHVRDQLSVPLMMGIGGALDIFAGDHTRAPRLWQRLGLEWLYRTLHEPRRLCAALMIPRFMARVLWTRAVFAIERFISLTEEEAD